MPKMLNDAFNIVNNLLSLIKSENYNVIILMNNL